MPSLLGSSLNSAFLNQLWQRRPVAPFIPYPIPDRIYPCFEFLLSYLFNIIAGFLLYMRRALCSLLCPQARSKRTGKKGKTRSEHLHNFLHRFLRLSLALCFR